MISIVLYGRNDNYGYNLHKRAALSFNCMAEVLEQDDDEILFVDYNTPNDFPTFPEAIQDTLTKKARERLRILRVRPHIHQRFKSKTRLVALEPIARNVAIRRSNPDNRWILSTNTDMIFVPQRAASLDEIVDNLPAGFYHAPRIEIPETLWESLDRTEARAAIDTVRHWGWSLHINEIVLGSPFILYDGPGDFQLMQRSDLFQIDGFDENMLLGWHVDSNIAARLTLVHGRVGDLGGAVYGYHCDHTRQITPAHSHSRTENDWRIFVDAVKRPDIPEQTHSWGCASDDIEEIRLKNNRSSVYVTALQEQIGEKLLVPPIVKYTGDFYNKTDYDARHLLPFLADLFISSDKGTNVAWFGARTDTLALFAGLWRRLGFSGKILVSESLVRDRSLADAPDAARVDLETLLAVADAFVIDFGRLQGAQRPDDFAGLPMAVARALNQSLLQIVQAEHGRLDQGASPRQIIAINAINNAFESLVMSHVGAGLTPYSTRMRHGFVLPRPKGQMDWTPWLQAGERGTRDGSIIRSREHGTGTIIYGPSRHVFAGHYRVVLEVSGEVRKDARSDEPVAVLEVASQRRYIAHRLVTPFDLARGEVEIEIDVSEQLAFDLGFALETRLRSREPLTISILRLTCERLADCKPAARAEAPALGIGNWLPLLYVGGAAVVRNGCIGTTGKPGYLLYGPYWALPAGEYEAVLQLEAAVSQGAGATWQCLRRSLMRRSPPATDIVCTFEAFSSGETLGLAVLRRDGLRKKNCVRLVFVVTAERAKDPNFALELRAYDNAILQFVIEEVRVRRIGTPGRQRDIDWLGLMTIGPAGQWDEGQIQLRRGIGGLVAHGPSRLFREGRYEIVLEFGEAIGTACSSKALLSLLVMSRGRVRAVRSVSASELKQSYHVIAFEVRGDESPTGQLPIDLHILSSGAVAGAVRSIVIRRIGDSTGASVWLEQIKMDWTPWLQVGAAGNRNAGGIAARAGAAGHVVYGPYWQLTPGRYRMTVHLAEGVGTTDVCGRIEVVDQLGVRVIAQRDFDRDHFQQGLVSLPFTIGAEGGMQVETRVWKLAKSRFLIAGIVVEPVDALKVNTGHISPNGAT
jgi:hypothetical protein